MNSDMVRRLFAWSLPGTRLNRPLRILIVTNAIFVFILGLFAPFYAVFIVQLGGNIAFAGLSWALYAIGSGVLILLFSQWELRTKEPELLIALGYLLRAGVFLSYAFMTNMVQLIATQLLWSIATALGTPAFDAVYAQHTSADDSIVEWGQWEGIAAISSGTAALLGGVTIQTFGYPTVFICMGLISAGLGAYVWRLPREVL